MAWLLNIAYLALLVLLTPWLLYCAVFKAKYREGFTEKFLGRVPRHTADTPSVWLHAVSVGEVNLLATVIDRLQKQRPDLAIFISTTTKTGFDLARTKYSDATVYYCPLDFSWAVAEAFRRIKPSLFILAELELWPNLIGEASRRGVPIAIINGRLSEKSHRGYMRLRSFFAATLAKVDLVAAQNETYALRFAELGAKPGSIVVTGSMKFDGAHTDRNDPAIQKLKKLAGFGEDDFVMVAGSTQHPEESLAVDAWKSISQDHSNVKLVIVPRHPDRFESVAAYLSQQELPWVPRTKLDETQSNAPILLVDCIGELGRWWGVADAGFVGGSMGSRGGQNMIEPAAFGVATCFGPNTVNFRDIVSLLLANEAAEVVKNSDEMQRFFRRCLEDAPFRKQLSENARATVAAQQGSADKTVQQLLKLLPAADSVGSRAA